MAIGNFSELPVETVTSLIAEVGKIGNWLQALGIIVVIWIVVQVVNLIFNFKRRKYLKGIEERLDKVDRKLNKIGRLVDKKRR